MLTASVAGIATALWAAGLFGPAPQTLRAYGSTGTVWFHDPAIGTREAGPYLRASTAVTALLAMDRREAIYFFTDKDASGARLRDDCSYTLSGTADMPARWWSVTLYADDEFLAGNDDDAHSIDAATLVEGPGAQWRATIAADGTGADNWLSTRNAGAFSLVLRLYNADPAVLDAPDRVPLPELQMATCTLEARS